ncbi:acetolactate synthase, large subunit [Marssonina coronariae]|uniref:Acetolactate synthase, large subunit n=1 Tax=Diplocarpon coronariae TaxID=2795749 RepID=A0A218Z9V9_9HELO|nr:acetolactate synthase, large subunit [Marssonina coronariae]
MAFEKEYPSPSILGGKRLSRKELRKASRELDQASRSKDTWSYGFAALQHGVCLDILAKAASRKAKTSTLHNEHSSHAVIHGATPRTIKEQPGFELPPRAQSTPVYYVTRPTSQPEFKRVFTENFDKLSVDMEDGRRKFPRRVRDMRKCERARKAWTGDLEAFCSVVEPNPSPMITVGPSLESSDILASTPDFIGPRERPTLPRSFSAFGKKAPGRSWDSMSPCREDRKSTSISRGKD